MASSSSSSSSNAAFAAASNAASAVIAQEVRERLAQAARELALQRKVAIGVVVNGRPGPVRVDSQSQSAGSIQAEKQPQPGASLLVGSSSKTAGTVKSSIAAANSKSFGPQLRGWAPEDSFDIRGRAIEAAPQQSLSGSNTGHRSVQQRNELKGTSQAVVLASEPVDLTSEDEDKGEVKRNTPSGRQQVSNAYGTSTLASSSRDISMAQDVQQRKVTTAKSQSSARDALKNAVAGLQISNTAPSSSATSARVSTRASSSGRSEPVNTVSISELMGNTPQITHIEALFDDEVEVGSFTLRLAPIPSNLAREVANIEAAIVRRAREQQLLVQNQTALSSKRSRQEETIDEMERIATKGEKQMEALRALVGKTSAAPSVSPQSTSSISAEGEPAEQNMPPKRKRGRPRKNPLPEAQSGASSSQIKVVRFAVAAEDEDKEVANKKAKEVSKKKRKSTGEVENTGLQPSQTGSTRRRQQSHAVAANVIPNTKITEAEIEIIMRRVANAVHMVEELLWPQFSTCETPRPKSTPELASSYWNAVSSVLEQQQDQDALKQVETILKNVHSQQASHADLMFELAYALAGNDKLIMGFDIFLPDDLSMTSLLVFQKLVIALVQLFDRSIVADKVKQRQLIRKGMDDLVDALADDQSFKYVVMTKEDRSAKSMLVGADGQKGNGGPRRVLKPIAPPSDKNQAATQAVEWIDMLLKKFGGAEATSNLCAQVMKALTELGEASCPVERAKNLVKFIRGAVRDDADLRTRFDSFAKTLFSPSSAA